MGRGGDFERKGNDAAGGADEPKDPKEAGELARLVRRLELARLAHRRGGDVKIAFGIDTCTPSLPSTTCVTSRSAAVLASM